MSITGKCQQLQLQHLPTLMWKSFIVTYTTQIKIRVYTHSIQITECLLWVYKLKFNLIFYVMQFAIKLVNPRGTHCIVYIYT